MPQYSSKADAIRDILNRHMDWGNAEVAREAERLTNLRVSVGEVRQTKKRPKFQEMLAAARNTKYVAVEGSPVPHLTTYGSVVAVRSLLATHGKEELLKLIDLLE